MTALRDALEAVIAREYEAAEYVDPSLKPAPRTLANELAREVARLLPDFPNENDVYRAFLDGRDMARAVVTEDVNAVLDEFTHEGHCRRGQGFEDPCRCHMADVIPAIRAVVAEHKRLDRMQRADGATHA